MPQNGINLPGITALAEAFAVNSKLRVLNLNDNTFTEAGAQAVAKVRVWSSNVIVWCTCAAQVIVLYVVLLRLIHTVIVWCTYLCCPSYSVTCGITQADTYCHCVVYLCCPSYSVICGITQADTYCHCVVYLCCPSYIVLYVVLLRLILTVIVWCTCAAQVIQC